VDSLFNVSVPLLVVSCVVDCLDLLPGWIVSTDYPIKLNLDLTFSCVHVVTMTDSVVCYRIILAEDYGPFKQPPSGSQAFPVLNILPRG